MGDHIKFIKRGSIHIKRHDILDPQFNHIVPPKHLIIKKKAHTMNTKTNKELGDEQGVTSRQISKSRRRGWIWKDGKRVKYTAPNPVFITSKKPKKEKK